MSESPNRRPDQRLPRMERQIAEIERELGRHASMLAKAPASPQATDDPIQSRDEIWSCSKCAARLGYYDADTDILRVRHRDFVAYVHLGGPGGFVRVLCRGCGELNELCWVDPTEGS